LKRALPAQSNGIKRISGYKIMRFWKNLPALIITLIAVFFIALIFLNKYSRLSISNTKSTVEINNLSSEILVSYNEYGIPHIEAKNYEDFAIGLGFVSAQNRLWQLDFLRRAAKGDLSVILGEKFVFYDKFTRALNLEYYAKKLEENENERLKRYNENFVNGINSFLKSNQKRLPIEFGALGYTPAEFTSKDIYLCHLFHQIYHSYNFKEKLFSLFENPLVAANLNEELIRKQLGELLISIYNLPLIAESGGANNIFENFDSTNAFVALSLATPLTLPSSFMQISYRVDGNFGFGIFHQGVPFPTFGTDYTKYWALLDNIDSDDFGFELAIMNGDSILNINTNQNLKTHYIADSIITSNNRHLYYRRYFNNQEIIDSELLNISGSKIAILPSWNFIATQNAYFSKIYSEFTDQNLEDSKNKELPTDKLLFAINLSESLNSISKKRFSNITFLTTKNYVNERIDEIVYSSVSINSNDARLIQFDYKCEQTERLIEDIYEILSKHTAVLTNNEQQQLESLKSWDKVYYNNSKEANFIEQFIVNFVKNREPKFAKNELLKYVPRKFYEIFEQNYYSTNYATSDTNSMSLNSKDYILAKVFKETASDLKADSLKNYDIQHIIDIYSSFSPLFKNYSEPIGGGFNTINFKHKISGLENPIIANNLRLIIDLKEKKVLSIVAGGISGEYVSSNYSNQLSLWYRSGYLSNSQDVENFILKNVLKPTK